jgi:hypothetical protein
MMFSLYIIYYKILYNHFYETLSEYGVSLHTYITHDHSL